MKRASRPPTRASQRGVALIMAVLMVALAMILAANVVFRGVLDQRRAATMFALDQAFEVALGAEAWAADFLQRDLQESKTDNLAETWAQPLPPLPIEGGSVAGRLEDLQGRFNLNNLVFADGTTNPDAVKQLERVLVTLDIEPKWASAMADWIDEDNQPGFPDGAEDSVYTGQTTPYLAANMPITRTSELLALAGFGSERYAKLKPYVSALPVGTPLNVCTAPGIVLDALTERTREFGLNPDDLAKRRVEGCFPTLADLRGALGDADYDKIKNSLSESSSYFGATVWVTIGTTDFTLYSLLVRNQGGLVRPQLRSFGTQ
ncbi:MAG TPA: type II secretion system minor pseudopilin GspK [Steroidobacteraceae bacterium]|nr:type II secretion system minor pseudopilin GspK [Steroidobacteraceae bacterium]HQR48180.1 type II secretion system minor pseudopilin GspK [Steroidobacteraceae bacterium]